MYPCPGFWYTGTPAKTILLETTLFQKCPLETTLSTAGNSMTSSERPSPEPILKKRGVPSRTGGERILETLWKPQMPWIIGLGASQPYSAVEFQETLWERFRGLSGIFPEFLPESPSRTGGMAYFCDPRKVFRDFQGFQRFLAWKFLLKMVKKVLRSSQNSSPSDPYPSTPLQLLWLLFMCFFCPSKDSEHSLY